MVKGRYARKKIAGLPLEERTLQSFRPSASVREHAQAVNAETMLNDDDTGAPDSFLPAAASPYDEIDYYPQSRKPAIYEVVKYADELLTESGKQEFFDAYMKAAGVKDRKVIGRIRTQVFRDAGALRKNKGCRMHERTDLVTLMDKYIDVLVPNDDN
jgi:hypothetical protein